MVLEIICMIVYKCGCVLSKKPNEKKRCAEALRLYKNGRFETFEEMREYWRHFDEKNEKARITKSVPKRAKTNNLF